MNTNKKIIPKTPVLNPRIVKKPIKSKQTAEPAWPQINSVLRPNIRTVNILTNDATKLTEQSMIVAIRGFSVSSPRTSAKIEDEKRVIAWKPVNSLKMIIAIETQLPLLCASSVQRAYLRVTSEVSPVFSVSRWWKIVLAILSLPCVLYIVWMLRIALYWRSADM